MTRIEHKQGTIVLLRMDYSFTPDDLPEEITEYGANGQMTAATSFEYDARRRLTRETRMGYDGTPPYDLTYDYDKGGNRIRKIDAVAQLETLYHYDVDPDVNPPAAPSNPYGSFNNRLQYYEVFDTTEPGEPGDPGALLSTTWYYYYYWDLNSTSSGNVERIVTKNEASATYQSTYFNYGRNRRTVTHMVGEEWQWDGEGSCVPSGSYGRTYAKEFRYDSARARYAARELDPGDFDQLYPGFGWSDYDGDRLYDDFIRSANGFISTARRFEPGIGRIGSSSASKYYYHTDHLGTVRGVSHAGSMEEPMAFTAFGEPIVGSQESESKRFGYVGSHGYQSTIAWTPEPDKVLPYLHVGHRYYDPSTGRFLQRDPIGVFGGTNVYGYVEASPTAFIDPNGLDFITSLPGIIQKGLTIGKKWAEGRMGTSSPWSKLLRPINLGADTLKCVPDLVRIKKAVDHRKDVLDSDEDINDALDIYDRDHKKNVKPGSAG